MEIAKLYLRIADFTAKKLCSIYEIQHNSGWISYKIFADIIAIHVYLYNNKDKKIKDTGENIIEVVTL